LEEKVQGSKGAVQKDAPHPDGNPQHRGTTEDHFQPTDRRTGGDGHTFVGPPAQRTTIAATLAEGLRSAGDAIGTASDNTNANSSNLEKITAEAWDFFDPASNIAEILRETSDIIEPKDEMKR
jgi:hypothetical protein